MFVGGVDPGPLVFFFFLWLRLQGMIRAGQTAKRGSPPIRSWTICAEVRVQCSYVNTMCGNSCLVLPCFSGLGFVSWKPSQGTASTSVSKFKLILVEH